MDRHILFYLVGRLILVNGLSLIIPLTAGLIWGERGILYFGPSLIAAVAFRRTASIGAAIISARSEPGKGPGTWSWYG